MPPKPISPELTGGIQSTPSPLFPGPAMTPEGPLGLLQPGSPPPRSPLEREMPPGLSFLQRFKTYGPGLLGALATMGLPGRIQARPVLGPLARTGVGAAVAGGTAALSGGSPKSESLKFAATQLPVEGGVGAGRLGIGQLRAPKALERAETEFQAGLKAHATATEKADLAHQTALQQHVAKVEKLKTEYAAAVQQREATIAKNQAEYAKAQRAFSEKGAQSIAEYYKKEVPSWKEFPSDERGIAEMVYGKGAERLGEMYDKALKEVVASGRGIKVPMRIEDLDALKLKSGEFLDSGVKGQPPTHAFIDAGELAQALPGTWKKHGGAYRRGFEVLDQQNLGNEEARREYRIGSSLPEFTDKSKMLAGGSFHPEAALKALYELKTLKTMRNRGVGDVFRGPIAEAVQSTPPAAPVEPPEIPKPILPERPLKPSPLKKPEKPDIGIKKTPIGPMTRFHLGGAMAEAPALLTGYQGFGPYVFGGLAGQAILPKSYYAGPGVPTPSPVPPVLPSTIAELLRAYVSRPRGETGNTPQ